MEAHLTIKHLAPYLPYKLMVNNNKVNLLMVIDVRDYYKPVNLIGINSVVNSSYLKPILRPLSDLTKEIEVNGEKFIPLKNLEKIIDEYGNADPTILIIKSFSGIYFEWYAGSQIAVRRSVPLSFYEKLYEWHFDVFGLIKEGLAIDINTL